MKTASTILEFRALRKELPEPVGFVPTMGYLHDGHISLVRAAKEQGCASVVVSIFVNPTQFGPAEDLAKYPRNPEGDLALLQAAGVDLVFFPTPEIMYPKGYQTWVTVEEVSQPLEGSMRPGHFRGVATVVAKLFNIVQPQKAFFGQKDAQQSAVLQRMVKDLDFPLEMVVCPTRREADGLAMSSRNTYLTPEQRQKAVVLHRSLTTAQKAYQQGEHDATRLRQIVLDILHTEPLAEVQYVSVANAESLLEVEGVTDTRLLISMAVYFGKTRLIDNILLP
ncbi:MAG TPA: pantoate--beta-alanine ligase [Longilinea sp.]|nr:pantoate--beta-alanine ligase [Longilinea sp.]